MYNVGTLFESYLSFDEEIAFPLKIKKKKEKKKER